MLNDFFYCDDYNILVGVYVMVFENYQKVDLSHDGYTLNPYVNGQIIGIEYKEENAGTFQPPDFVIIESDGKLIKTKLECVAVDIIIKRGKTYYNNKGKLVTIENNLNGLFGDNESYYENGHCYHYDCGKNILKEFVA